MSFKFQVVCTDKRDYIIEHANYSSDYRDRYLLLDYIKDRMLNKNIQTIKITRWNENGERE